MPIPKALKQTALRDVRDGSKEVRVDQTQGPVAAHGAENGRSKQDDISMVYHNGQDERSSRRTGTSESEDGGVSKRELVEQERAPRRLSADDAPALHPKVQLRYDTKPGELPRRVQIERLLRQYQQEDVAELIREHLYALGDELVHEGVDDLPLEVFDNTDFDCRTPEEWADHRAIALGLRARAVVHIRNADQPLWLNCTVLGYEGQNRYRVSLDEHQPAMVHQPDIATASKTFDHNQTDEDYTSQPLVPRVNLWFVSEDPLNFAERHTQAMKMRADTKRHLRYNIMVESMPTDDVPPLTAEQVNRILGYVLNTKSLRERVVDSSQIVNEINIDYATALNVTSLNRRLRDVDEDERDPHTVDVEVELPPSGHVTVPKTALVSLPEYNFIEQFSEFSFNTFFTRPEAIHAVTKVLEENNKLLRSTSFFSFFFTKSLRLEDFEKLQRQQIDQTATYLRDQWTSTIRNAIRSCFRRSGKGWFNLDEEHFEIHRYSKLRKFLTMTRFRMEDTLRMLVNESLEQLVHAVRCQCEASFDVQGLQAIDVSQLPGRADRRRAPLFCLDVQVDENRGEFVFSHSLDKFASTVENVFLLAVRSVQSIPDIEPLVMSKIHWTYKPRVTSVSEHELHLIHAKDELGRLIVNATHAASQYLAFFKEFEYILQFDVNAYIRRLQGDDNSDGGEEAPLSTLLSEIDKHQTELEYLKQRIPPNMTFGPFQINNMQAYENVRKKKEHIIEQIFKLIASVPRRVNQTICDRFKELNKSLRQKTSTPEDVKKQRDLIASIPKTISELMQMYEDTQEYVNALDRLRYPLSDEDIQVKADAQYWPTKLTATAETIEKVLAQDEKRYMQEQEEEQESFVNQIIDLQSDIDKVKEFADLAQVSAYYYQVQTIHQQLTKAEETTQLYNSRERLFGKELTDYSKLQSMKETFQPFYQFWTTAANWYSWYEQWMNGPFKNVDPEQVDKNVNQAFKTIYRLNKTFAQKGMEQYQKNCERVKSDIESFKQYAPVVSSLRAPGMRDRHWERIRAETEIEVYPSDQLTLADIINKNLHEHITTLEHIADVANKEHNIENSLKKMADDWKDVQLSILNYKDTGTQIVRVDEEVTQQLDDHIVMVQSMSFSPYKKPFEDQIHNWDKSLNLVSEVLDEWLALQRQWLYLEPIFASEDITTQLPMETKRFEQVDRTWRRTMQMVKEMPHIIRICSSRKLLEQFSDCNKLLETVQKGLSEYLETKRLAFARFFFLSNDELLQILSQTKNPLAVQPHLRKCFEAMASLDFEDDQRIVGMNSVEDEKLPVVEFMYPKGNVEYWLAEVERIMRKSVRQQVIDALEDYGVTIRNEWVRKWTGMAVLTADMAQWTRGTERNIENGNLEDWYNTQVEQLRELTELVRKELGKNERTTLSALIVIDVHARDVVRNLSDQGISRTNDFDWISQLRFYWQQEDMYVKMVQASVPFGYEYIGNTSRLVVTPLTDRCYMTLMGAIRLNLGGAPSGPAGTGKTETTKDLAKAVAQQCVVFNCSDGLDYLAMAKFFKGLAACGAWACFDEFNRIDLEVLSVVAQQIQTIQFAIQQGLRRFTFEDTEIDLKPSCSVFITMNPGYAGRSELPDNLKALFRPCAMMVPDYSLIGEISLMSFGFQNARPLAKKMVVTFKLCSEQLSAQDHYDYGMRAVKTVITAAGNLKRVSPDADEETLVLRSLMDVNVPKFLEHDLPLFKGIISDLFPDKSKPEPQMSTFMDALSRSCYEMGIQPVEGFTQKVVQLYETTIVRHGIMLVGPTCGAKTSCYQALALTMGILNDWGQPGFEKVKYTIINPKAVTMGQLYGDFDEDTHEWTDGILALYMRDHASSQSSDMKWIMFDGPVDALWIENMNTVLDDNKKLCLVSGEIIQMSSTMTMLFEVEDLAVASPATVSRCGMVYLDPSSLDERVLLQSWLDTLPELFQPMTEDFKRIFNALVPGEEGILNHIRRNWTEVVSTVNASLLKSFFKLMDSFILPYLPSEEDGKTLSEEDAANARLSALPLFLFSFFWSICATVDEAGRVGLDKFVREKANSYGFAEHMPPTSKSMYEWCFDQSELQWKEWMEIVPSYTPDPKQDFTSIIVPTVDTMRYTYIIDRLLLGGKNVLCVGATGTGKSLNVINKLKHHMPNMYSPIFLNFSARTTANQTQDFIDSKLDKRRRGVFGPPSGQKYILFVDDLNMPQREKYFAQPPIELLRQWLDHGGWYERSPPCSFKRIIDTQMIGCMCPPGGGRNPVTARLLRHFNMIAFTEMSNESLHRIFNTILQPFLERNFNKSISNMSNTLTSATIDVYNTVRSDFLPTPARSHYTFNLRDVARVFQGLLRASPEGLNESEYEFHCLWLHENLRVFSDRLINDTDRIWFRNILSDRLVSYLSTSWESTVGGHHRLLFGDFVNPSAGERPYQRITDLDELKQTVDEALEDFNSVSKAPMNLVMFMDAIEHVSRICRVIRLPLGNALLLGVGGSGRRSLTKLATYLEDYELYQIEISRGYGRNEWRDDLRSLLLRTGADGREITFLFVDTQIVYESFLEDINNLLNSGEVPNLWKTEDTEYITNTLRPIMIQQGMEVTKLSINSYFIQRVRNNLHIVLAMSPIGDAFRQRLRMFPSLVNCCTIDWFSEWPADALESVAWTYLSDLELSSEQLTSSVVRSFIYIHQSVESKSRDFFHELQRHNYVTPTSYLELLQTFIKLHGEKRHDIEKQRQRLQTGLDKLNSTANEVEGMEKELTDLKPSLERTQKEVDDMMEQIKSDNEEAEKTKETVSQQEADANEKAQEAKEIADDAQADLDKALPALNKALESLKHLSTGDVVEVKALKNPPAGVKLTMEACCIMFQVKPKMVTDNSPGAKPGAKVPDYWEPSTKMLNDPRGFLHSLQNYDRDNIPDEVIQKIEPYIQREDFRPEQIKQSSKACESICMWVRAMYNYHQVALQVAPKRERLAQAQAELDRTNKELEQSQQQLREVQQKLQELDEKYQEAMHKKEHYSNEVERVEAQMNRAQKLLGGLGGERTRWEETVEQLSNDLVNVVGDVVVASGVVAYSGPFTPAYRSELANLWMEKLSELQIPHTHNTSLSKILADPVKVREWNLAGLPADTQSVENGIIVDKARRWPLMVDPQEQANKWIKQMEKENNLKVVKQNDAQYIRTISNAIRFGQPVLMENVGEDLDPTLEPLLLKQTYKQGGSEVIRFGDDIIPYHQDFRFYITTKLRNPHYTPEISVKVSLLNFFVTQDGLEDQLLGITVAKERADLAKQKNELTESNARMKRELKELEDKILYMLSNSQGNILDDEELINTLSQSKATSDEVSKKVQEAEETEKTIDETRELYRPVAIRSSILFFCISDLAVVDPMYQYSLSWFIGLFQRAMDDAEQAEAIDGRVQNLNSYFTYSLYQNVCRSLFEQHKLMLSLLLCTAIMKRDNRLDPAEWRFWLAGATDTSVDGANPDPSWVTDKMWIDICKASKLEGLSGFMESFKSRLKEWKRWFESSEPQEKALPGDWESKLTPFQKLIVLRCIRVDKLSLGISNFVSNELGKAFIEPPPLDVREMFKESDSVTPLIFVLSSGADPMADLQSLADEMKMRSRFEQVSLGQGQGPKAERLIRAAADAGQWVCLQNCHLAQSWMPRLEQLVEELDKDKVHKDFRLWLTAMPSSHFPVSVLQNGIKITMEPPKGLKSNLKQSFQRISQKWIDESGKPEALRKLTFAMCMFHAVVQDRKKFGPLGWNIRYAFTAGDLSICQTQIKMLLDEYKEVPYRVIRVLSGDVNYGGRVTDDKDRRLLNDLLERFVNPKVVEEDSYQFSESGIYYCPNVDSVSQIQEYVESLPIVPKPEILGLHENAEITSNQNEAFNLLQTVLSMQPRQTSQGTGSSRSEDLTVFCSEMLASMPEQFDIEHITRRYPTRYEESMNTVLAQECIRYNGLLSVVTSTLHQCVSASKGLVVMSPELDSVMRAIGQNKVPDMWNAKGFKSLKPLSSWTNELQERVEFLNRWIANGPPASFWISGFFFPQAFLTGTMQNFARKHKLAIDSCTFEHHVMDHLSVDTAAPPEEGCYVHGFFLEGARWDSKLHKLCESHPKELFTQLPIVWLKPVTKKVKREECVYTCPVYKTVDRAGTLSTTGHSTNYITDIELASDKPHSHWVQRSVALFTALPY